MSDWIDDANEVIEVLQNAAIRTGLHEARKREEHPDFNGTNCVDCEEVIPPVRLAHGKVRCVDCQTVLEYRAKQRA